MRFLPMYHWIKKGGSAAEFPSFSLDAEIPLSQGLRAQLDCLPITKDPQRKVSLNYCTDLHHAEAYLLEIRKDLISIHAEAERGFYYGLAALKILLAAYDGVLPLGTIRDIPDFSSRGIMLDVSRGKMPSMSYLKQLIGFLSDIKYNILQLYCEDKLALEGHPLLGKLNGAYTREQIMELDQFCRSRYVELQPCIQTYSHMHGLLRLPGYSDLSENADLFSFAAGKESVYQFLEDELHQVLPWFSSKTLNINMDEAYDIGTGFSRPAAEEMGRGPLFLSHILRVIAIAERNGIERVQLWGDIVQKYPDLISRLPENTTIIEWNYNPLDCFASLENFKKTGRDFWAAGGVSSWNSIFPRVYNSYINLTNLSGQAHAAGATGFLTTDWGDYGHMQPLGLSLYGYMIGALQACSAKSRSGAQLEEALWPLIFADKDERVGFRALMDSNLAPQLQTDFKTMSIYYFFDDMLAGAAICGSEKYPKLSKETFQILSRCGSAACISLERTAAHGSVRTFRFPDAGWQSLFGEAFLQELRLSAWMTKFTGKKGLLACRIRQSLAEENPGPEDIMSWIFEIHQLYREFCNIRRMFEDVWQLRAERAGIQTSLALFDQAGVQMGETVRWLARQREALLQGGQPDRSLASYSGRNCKVLWTADFKNMWDRAYPWR